MSVTPLGPCNTCKSALAFEFVARMSANDESSYGVSWICPTCKSRALDVCAVGPVIPMANCCLNCGARQGAGGKCTGCGMQEAAALAWFGIGEGASIEAANRNLSEGLVRRALGRINHLLRDDPGAVDAWRFKAHIYVKLGFHGTAARMLRHAAEATRTPAFLVSAGFSLQEIEQHDGAVELYREFLATAPDDELAATALCNLGNALSALGRDAEAEEPLKRAIELEPARATYAINHYALLCKLGRPQDAIGALRRGLRDATDPDARPTLLRAVAHAHAELGEGEAALTAAEQALAADARSPQAWYLLGRAHGLLGNLELGRDAMKHALSIDPSNAGATRALGMFERALAGKID
jgi:tetratricopeptide (TPR) repeat protein